METLLVYKDEYAGSDLEYFAFLTKCYVDRASIKFYERGRWYHNGQGYKILLAIRDNKIVGQSCAFKAIAIVKGKEMPIWWGCDSFVLAEARGCGLGKLLQKKLHEDLPNFSSAYYAPTNGHIKRKLGAKELFPIEFTYYPVSSCIFPIGNMLASKYLKRKWPLIHIPNFYYYLNRLPVAKYKFKKVELTEELVNKMQTSLQLNDFYIRRDWTYMKWRYIDTPNLSYSVIEISDNDMVLAHAIISSVCSKGNYKVVYLMDQFVYDKEHVTNKNILGVVTSYIKEAMGTVDGVYSLQNANWLLKFIYPKPNAKFLSTIEVSDIKNPYVSYSDQDMVQIYD